MTSRDQAELPSSSTTDRAQDSSAPSPPTVPPPTNPKRQSILNKAFSRENRIAAQKFFSAYANTWIGLSPIWLMGEALTPGAKVGSKFKQGSSKLFAAAQDLAKAVSTSSRDIVVIVDSKLNERKDDTTKTAEVIKAAGENAMVVVTSSLDKVQSILNQSHLSPEIKRTVTKNGRDVIIIMDKALKHPIVVTGVARFARSKGIPHAEALLQLASLGLAKILRAIPEEHLEGIEKIVEEVDAAELEKASSAEEAQLASEVGKQSPNTAPDTKPSNNVNTKHGQCLLM